MHGMNKSIVATLASLVLAASTLHAADTDAPAALTASVEQLRHVVGDWDVTTEFLNEDGSIARSVSGSYAFHWVVVDRVVAGRSDIPELKQSSGILFYVNESKQTIEMVSVGADGNLWIMTGKAGEEVRYTQEFDSAAGKAQLRFTRYNVSADRFASRMEYSEDGGKTWKPGNHQLFERKN